MERGPQCPLTVGVRCGAQLHRVPLIDNQQADQQDQTVESLTNFAYVSFRVGVAERRMRGRFADAQGVAFQYPIQGSEASVSVMDQIPALQKEDAKAKRGRLKVFFGMA